MLCIMFIISYFYSIKVLIISIFSREHYAVLIEFAVATSCESSGYF